MELSSEIPFVQKNDLHHHRIRSHVHFLLTVNSPLGAVLTYFR